MLPRARARLRAGISELMKRELDSERDGGVAFPEAGGGTAGRETHRAFHPEQRQEEAGQAFAAKEEKKRERGRRRESRPRERGLRDAVTGRET